MGLPQDRMSASGQQQAITPPQNPKPTLDPEYLGMVFFWGGFSGRVYRA